MIERVDAEINREIETGRGRGRDIRRKETEKDIGDG